MATILLIARREEIALFVKLAFEHAGLAHQVDHVSGLGPARRYLGPGMSAIRSHPLPDLILLGSKLPLLEYCELLSWLRSEDHLSRIPVCLLNDVGPALQAGLRLVLESRVLGSQTKVIFANEAPDPCPDALLDQTSECLAEPNVDDPGPPRFLH